MQTVEDNNVVKSEASGLNRAVKKTVPELCNPKESCCGCSACYVICPANAINMIPDDEGFLYPNIDTDKCVRCNRCISVCAFKQNQEVKGIVI